ncbi:MAG: hypothetical protein Q8O67_01885 [Deltaproteobacteria bacterium]|nr:hypothetical protein [Deltaproteobacteria bacterium]
MRRSITLLFLMMGGCTCDDGALGQLVPLLARDVDRLAFDDTFVGGSRSLTLTLTNTGTANVRFKDPVLDGDAFNVDTTGFDLLEPGQRLALNVSFTPLLAQEFTGALSVDSDGGDVVVVIEGTGLTPLSCDDGEECTDESFDPQLGVCLRSDRDGPCDDDSACTDDDRCFAGSCVGDALVCADTVDCTLDVCDPARGCVFVGDPAACVDDDPCSLDVCDPNAPGSGCSNPPAPDGTPCGSVQPCVSVSLCIVQQCTAVPIPEGTPCSDGDVCTADDACTAGACAGVPNDRPPEVISETFRVVQDNGPAVVVGDLLVMGEPTLKVVPLGVDGGAPSTSIPALANVSHLVAQRGGTKVIGLSRSPHTGRSGEAQSFAVVVDLADPALPLVMGSVPVGELLRGPTIFGASETHAFICTSGDLLRAIDLVTMETSTVDDEPGLCALSRDASAAFDGTQVVLDSTFGSGGVDEPALVLARVDVDGVVLQDVVFDRPAALPILFVDGTRGAGIDAAGGVTLIDLDDPAVPQLVDLDLAGLGPGMQPVALHGGRLYFVGLEGLRRVDISDVDAPVVDDWLVQVGVPTFASVAQRVILAVDDERVIFAVDPDNPDVQVVGARGSGVVRSTAVRAQRSLGLLVEGDGLSLSLTSAGMSFIDDNAVVDAAVVVAPVFASAVIVNRLQLATSLFAQVIVGADRLHTDTGLLERPALPRRDVRAALGSRDGRTLGRVTLLDDGEATLGFGLGVAFPEGVSLFVAPVAEGCVGAALAQASEPDGVDGAQPVQAFGLSVCVLSRGVDVVPLGSIDLPFNRVDLGSSSSTQHGTRVTFIGADEAVLVDFSDPVHPFVAAAVELPELAGAAFASVGSDLDAWVFAFTYVDGRAPRVVIFDVQAMRAIFPEPNPVASFDDGAVTDGQRSVRKRVLGVSWPRAFISNHDDTESAERGWSIAAWDLSAVPPVVVDTLPVTGEPIDVVIQEEQLIVSRFDGLTVISPPCGP